MINSIWSTPEAYAWSRDFDYPDYLTVIKVGKISGRIKETHTLLSEKAYRLARILFEHIMEEDIVSKC